jgi:hypothetical protein
MFELNVANYPEIVWNIWPIVERLVAAFAAAPFRYANECDVHVALASRIDA